MTSKSRSKKRDAAKKKRSQRGWSMRSNRTPVDPREEALTEVIAPVDPLPSIDAPAPASFLEKQPWWARWMLLVSVALLIGTLTGFNFTVQLGLTAGVATLLAGGAFLAAFLPPSLRERPGDSAAVGFGSATGHDRPEANPTQESPPANRAARRRARRAGAE